MYYYAVLYSNHRQSLRYVMIGPELGTVYLASSLFHGTAMLSCYHGNVLSYLFFLGELHIQNWNCVRPVCIDSVLLSIKHIASLVNIIQQNENKFSIY
jgi:hypothetical protein